MGHGNAKMNVSIRSLSKTFQSKWWSDMVWKIYMLIKFSYIEVYSGIVAFAGKKKTQWLLGIIVLCKGPVHNYANYANELFQNVFVKPMPNSN